MDVSVIIVNYNTKDITLNCIESIKQQTKDVEIEIILVDNNSQDGSVEFFSNYDGIKFIKSDTNLGFGKANNLGVSFAKGNYIFLLNSDCYLLNNAIKHFHNYYLENLNTNIGVLGCLLVDTNFQTGSSFGKFHTIKNVLHNQLKPYINIFRKENKKQNLHIRLPMEVQYIIGADLFFRKNILNDTQLFDEKFFMYAEENEFQYRLAKMGYKRLIIPGPKIQHLEGKSTKRKYFDKEKMATESIFIFIKKHNRFGAYIFFRIAYFCISIPRILLLNYNIKDKISYIKFLAKARI